MDTSRHPVSSIRPRPRRVHHLLLLLLFLCRLCRRTPRYLSRYHLQRHFLWLAPRPRNLRPPRRSRHLLPRPRCNLKHTCATTLFSVPLYLPPRSALSFRYTPLVPCEITGDIERRGWLYTYMRSLRGDCVLGGFGRGFACNWVSRFTAASLFSFFFAPFLRLRFFPGFFAA